MESMTQIRRLFLDVAGVRICCVDFGGEGAPVLLLHGLAGRANEWRNTADWLRGSHHTLALDQRGHGMSDKSTRDYSREAFVRDIVGVIEQLRLPPTVLIGQSMGGLNALLVAAHRPDLVRGLIVVEATPTPNPTAQPSVRRWLDSWPLPFPTLADARVFFGGDTLYAHTWLEVLEEHPDGYWPQFQIESMLQAIDDLTTHDYWRDWEQIQCPTLVVGGANSALSQDELREMARRISCARYIEIPNAGHDPHLEQPEAWRQAAEAFLREVGDSARTS